MQSSVKMEDRLSQGDSSHNAPCPLPDSQDGNLHNLQAPQTHAAKF